MSDTHQAIYDAVRSRLSNCDVGHALESALRNANFGDSFGQACNQMSYDFGIAWTKPSVVYKPTLIKEGNAWMAIYGDLPTGVVGCGETPSKAMDDFDAHWNWTEEQIKKQKETRKP